MAEVNPPYVLQAGSHPADVFRRAMEALLGGRTGVRGPNDLLVSALATPNMTVNVAAGEVFVPGTESALPQGVYHCYNDATRNLTIAAANATNPRRDLVVARVRDSQYSGATNAWDLFVVTGTPAATPADPATPANSVVLARVAVGAAATSIVAGNLTDLRPRAAALGGTVVCLSTTRPTTDLYEGLHIYETDTDKEWVWDNATWNLPKNRAGGALGRATRTSDQGGITAETDLTGLSVTVDVGAGRLIRISAKIEAFSNVANDAVVLKIKEGVTILDNTTGPMMSQGGVSVGVKSSVLVTPSAGSHTYKLTLARAVGSGTVTLSAGPDRTAFILVEDIGGA